MSIKIFDTIKTCYGEAAVGKEVSDTIDRINKQSEKKEVVLDDEIKLERMKIVPFKINAIVQLNKPIITSCTRPELNRFAVVASPYNNPGYPHTSSVWEITLGLDFNTPLISTESTTELNSIIFNLLKITSSTTYRIRLKHKAYGLESPWSDTFVVTTADPLPIEKPSILLVEQYDPDNPDLLIVTSSIFNHAELTHTKSIWEVCKTSDFHLSTETEDAVAPLTAVNTSITEIESDTDYYFRVKYLSEDINRPAIESPWSDPFLYTSKILAGIDKPVLSIEDPVCPFNFRLQGTPFVSSNPALEHTNTHWAVSSISDFSTTIVDLITPIGSGDLTSILIDNNLCEDETPYFARAKYISEGIESEWSDVLPCTTAITYESYPKRKNLTPVELKIEPYVYLIGCGNKLIVTLPNDETHFDVFELALDASGGKTLLTTIAVDWYETPMSCGTYNLLYYAIKEVANNQTFIVVKELNLTTKVSRTISSRLLMSYPFNLSYSSLKFDNGTLWLISGNDTSDVAQPNSIYQIPLDGSLWIPMDFSGKVPNVDCPPLTYAYLSTISNGKIYLLDHGLTQPVWVCDIVTNTWTKPVNTPITKLYSRIQLMENYDDTILVVLMEPVDTAVADMTFIFSFHLLYSDPMGIPVWVKLQNVPGLTDLNEPSFGVMGDELYAIALEIGRALPPVIIDITAGSQPVGNLAGNQIYSNGYTFEHEGKLGLCATSVWDNFSMLEVSLTDVSSGDSIKKVVDFGDFAYPMQATVCYGDGKIFISNGYDATTGNYLSTLYQYDINTAELTQLLSDNPVNEYFAMIYREGKLYFFGGYSPIASWSNSKILDLSTKTWELGLLPSLQKTASSLLNVPNGIIIYDGSNPNNAINDKKIFLWNLADNSLTDMGTNVQDVDNIYQLYYKDGYLYSIHEYVKVKSGFEIFRYNGTAFEPYSIIPLVYEAAPTLWLKDLGDGNYVVDDIQLMLISVCVGAAGRLFCNVSCEYNGTITGGAPQCGGNCLVILEPSESPTSNYYQPRDWNNYEYFIALHILPPTFSKKVEGKVWVEIEVISSADDILQNSTILYEDPGELTMFDIYNGACFITNVAPFYDSDLINYDKYYPIQVRVRLGSINNSFSDWSNKIIYNLGSEG